MIFYQLPNGRTIQTSYEALERMSKSDIDFLSHNGYGNCSENPFKDDILEDEIDTVSLDDQSLDIEDPDSNLNDFELD